LLSLLAGNYTKIRVSKNNVLRKIFEIKAEKITGGWRKFHKEEVHDFYASSYFIMSVKLRRM
jgi:hypothetical protein